MDPITRLNAALEGRYRIESELGEGGMATVYLADDLKHERKVAVKVLKPELAAVVGADRFLAEIKTTANLQHPHILPLHDSGEADGFLYYVMPYVEGESLRDRLEREKQLPVDEAVRIATDVAEALHSAHEQGVIHRDIKPANILMSKGRPLVADFGIALAVSAAGGGRLTETGTSIGSPFYMSPEQASADRVPSAASDVYSLGCVLYEMLVGEPPYTGPSAQAVLAQILMGDAPAPTTTRPSVPANVDAAIRRALEKLPADRFAGAQEFAMALTDVGFRYGEEATPKSGDAPGQWTPLTMAATGLALVFGLIAGWGLLQPEPALPVARFDITPPEGRAFFADLPGVVAAISPDGQRMVYVGPGPQGDGSQLWQRVLSDLQLTPIAGTEGGDGPVFSPDGLSLAFQSDGSLKTVSLGGGPVFTVSPSASPYVDWGEDGMLYFASTVDGLGLGIYRVPATGGQPEQVTDPVEGVRFQHPEALPDGKGVLVTLRRSRPSEATIGVLGPEGGAVRELFPGMSARYAASGHIVYATADNTLMAAPFDLGSLDITGGPVAVLQGVAIRLPGLGARFSLSEAGTLVYLSTSGAQGLLLQTFDFQGNTETLALGRRDIQAVSWSPDGESIVYSSDDHIYTHNVLLGTPPRQLTSEGINTRPVYSPDGTSVAFSSRRTRTDDNDLFVKNLNDDAPPRSLITFEANQLLTQWHSDSLIVFEVGGNTSGSTSSPFSMDLWTVDLSDPDNPRATEYLSSEADLRRMVISPDGTLAAYSSNESGRREVYVSGFPDPGEPTIVSQNGGNVPWWSPDGNTLYMGAGSSRPLEAARIQRNPMPVVMSIEVSGFSTGQGATPFQGAGLHPDGVRFIMAAVADWAEVRTDTPDQLILVQSFFGELKRLAPN